MCSGAMWILLWSHYLIHDFVITLVYLCLFKVTHFINNRKICVLSILHFYAAKFSWLMFLWCSCFYLHILSHWSPSVQCMLKDLKVYHPFKTCKKTCRIICFTRARVIFPQIRCGQCPGCVHPIHYIRIPTLHTYLTLIIFVRKSAFWSKDQILSSYTTKKCMTTDTIVIGWEIREDWYKVEKDQQR